MTDHPKHFISIDVLRLLAAFCVVALHCCTSPCHPLLSEPLTRGWWIAHLLSSTKICVPLFVMISGFFLLDAEHDAWNWASYRRRMARILIPLVTWVLLYSVLSIVNLHRHGPLSLALVKGPVIRGTAYFHLWYLFMIAGIYAFSPFFLSIVRQSTPTQSRVLLLLLFFFAQAYWLITAFVGRKYYCVINDMLIFPPYLFYFFAGSVVRRLQWSRLLAVGLVLCFVFSWGAGVLGESALFMLRGKSVGLFHSYFSPTVMGMTLSLFALIVIQETKFRHAQRWVKQRLDVIVFTIWSCRTYTGCISVIGFEARLLWHLYTLSVFL